MGPDPDGGQTPYILLTGLVFGFVQRFVADLHGFCFGMSHFFGVMGIFSSFMYHGAGAGGGMGRPSLICMVPTLL
ncbi:hypothetical protein [Alteribacillus bidgolensis]|uniref:hypothetical protein n=1 Tax=Alteribacillus bidgolensis TaxID=930129 RepID=UPI000B82750E|nr:hypothetical protein [Alteribacillus bidgolensis]